MKIFLLLAMIVAFGLLPAHGDLMDFVNMVQTLTGKDAIFNYGSYGCHCGVKGQGPFLDATDWCCFEQQCCYNQLKKNGCETVHQNYKADYKGNQVTCVNEDSCKKQLCECDKKTALCLTSNIYSYNEAYRFYERNNCNGKAPPC